MANSPGRGVVDVGSVIADTYQLEAVLGRGGMGAVFLASHLRLAGRRVAIKILHTEIEDADIVARFKREAEIAAKLNHPNIVGVIDYNVSPDGMPYLVLDYLEGETLAQPIARGPMAIDRVLSIVRQVGSALAAAHRAGIVHRDLKPQNIFLVPTEVDGRVVEIAKVLDFGISKIRGSQTVKTQDSTLLGTPQYMAPEQATGQHALVDERTDEFALGAIVYEMLTGRPAFSGASIPEVVFKVVYDQPVPLVELAPATPPVIVDAVVRAMAKPLEDRFPTVTAFVEAVIGQPLTVTRGAFPVPAAAADSPSAARRVATHEAFAQTMGSAAGHAALPVNPMLATMAPATANQLPSQLAHGTQNAAAAAVASGTAAGGRIPATNSRSPAAVASTAYAAPATSATLPPAVTVSLAPARKGRSVGVIAGVAIVAAAVAAVAVFVATRPTPTTTLPTPPPVPVVTTPVPPTPPTPAPPTPPPPTPPAPTPPPPTPPAPTPPAPPAPVDTAKLTAKPKPPSHPATPPPAPAHPAADDTGGDPDVNAKLAQGHAALDRHDYDSAEKLANTLVNTATSPRQRAAAHLLHGLVQCEARNDQEAAQIDLRNLSGYPNMRLRLITDCRRHGVIQ